MSDGGERTGVLVEAAVDSVASALAAERGGAGRLELCAALGEGGTTPSAGMIDAVRERVRLPVFVMVRPRAGDFLYTAEELDSMLRDVEHARRLGVDGIVTGALDADGEIDGEAVRVLVEASHPLPVTFHRAMDVARDPAAAVDALLALGVARVLTSGGAARAAEGTDTIAAMVRRAAGGLVVMAGGGVTGDNARAIVDRTGVREVHLRGAARVESAMRWRRESVSFASGRAAADEYAWQATSEDAIRRVVEAVAW